MRSCPTTSRIGYWQARIRCGCGGDHRGLTQEDQAAAARAGKSYVSQIEAGKKSGAEAVLKRMASALRVDLDHLTPVEV